MRSTLLSDEEINALLYSGTVGNIPLNAAPVDADELGQASRYSISKFYFPLDPITINLADLDGDRFAEVGITFQIREQKSADDIEKILPFLRSAILVSLSEKKSEDLLSRNGKQKLVADIFSEVEKVFVMKSDTPLKDEVKPSKLESIHQKNHPTNPVLEVLFSSLIVE